MRDFLSATRERVLSYDGGMGATLEQFDLSLEDDFVLRLDVTSEVFMIGDRLRG